MPGLLHEPEALAAGSIVTQGMPLETVRQTMTATLRRRPSRCLPYAERARKLRMAGCKTGRHLDDEPLPGPDPRTDDARPLVQLHAATRRQSEAKPHPSRTSWSAECDECIEVKLSPYVLAGRDTVLAVKAGVIRETVMRETRWMPAGHRASRAA
ncbi:hypothetical protein [Protofrankia symbiont of Coriaria ruscifolia]|uniref:hypothetical protein n=1 Tax=Protofrankia symbiont of Coriaria ruscifolia TaxID=1306542 RepID=UPI001A940B79|nr:hypothetical protein [Protofrankia symbiont of Coriaria ruscifolia]